MTSPAGEGESFPCTLELLCAALPAVAQDALTPLIVTASRTPHPALEVPYSTSALDLEELRENQVRTLPEALRHTPFPAHTDCLHAARQKPDGLGG